MSTSFADTLRRLRTEKGLSQQQLADMLFVDRSSVAHWESGRRIPDTMQITRISKTLDCDVNILFGLVSENDSGDITAVLVDDENIILTGELSVLNKVLPKMSVTGFTNPADALEFVRKNKVNIAFLDIELGKTSGIALCRKMLEIQPNLNVIFLTAYMEYSMDAWSTGASGFIVKPINKSSLAEQLRLLRYPVKGLVIE
ncbi:Helix-turn-helix [Ruminococcaceae bacterium YRB3002]|nr:Helix-turn-helix [Ruminococcaceae bacterium YRB3002]